MPNLGFHSARCLSDSKSHNEWILLVSLWQRVYANHHTLYCPLGGFRILIYSALNGNRGRVKNIYIDGQCHCSWSYFFFLVAAIGTTQLVHWSSPSPHGDLIPGTRLFLCRVRQLLRAVSHEATATCSKVWVSSHVDACEKRNGRRGHTRKIVCSSCRQFHLALLAAAR